MKTLNKKISNWQLAISNWQLNIKRCKFPYLIGLLRSPMFIEKLCFYKHPTPAGSKSSYAEIYPVFSIAIANWQSTISKQFLPITYCLLQPKAFAYCLLKPKAFAYCLLLIITSCNNQEKETEQTATSDKIQKVEVITPKQRSFTAEILITGRAQPNQVVTIYAMESGILSQIKKEIGDKTQKGETIAVLENPELVQQQIKLKAELQAKESIYNRLKSVYEKTPALTNIQQVENAEAEYLSAKANLDAVNSRLSFLNVKAPFSGIITKRFVDNGALLQNGLDEDNPQPIVEIQEINPIRLTIPVPETDATALKQGLEVQVTFPELSGKPYTAKISRTSKALDQQSKTMQVEIDIANENGTILTGMYAKVMMKINSRSSILSLPVISKMSFNNEDFVLVVENKIVKRVPVKIGLSDKDYFEVLNAKITEKTQVIVQGKGLVNDGQVVEPIIK